MRRLPLLLLLLACDWEHYGLVNSVPLGPPQNVGRPVHVFLGLDGTSRAAFDEAMAEGAFAGFNTSTLIPMYPATSDASWSRLLHTRRIPGYEFTYYDPTQDQIVDPGLTGVLQHIIPPFDIGIGSAPAFYKAFDVHSSDYLDAIGSYTTTQLGFEKELDNIFFVLAGRLGTDEVFFSYILETDVLGHSNSESDVVAVLKALSARMAKFAADHRDHPVLYTLFTDHGLDHIQKPDDHVIATTPEVAAAGVRTVQSFADGRKGAQPWAVVIEHTRTTYVAVHTEDAQADEVARRISINAKFDLVVSRSLPLAGDALDPSWPRVSIWKDGARVAYFAFDAATNTYYLGAGLDEAALDVGLPFGSDAFAPFSDADLFAATAGRAYPDVFFRARTALEPVSVQYPAQVVASLKTDYVCVGYRSAFFSAAGTAGSHGTLARASSEGILATQERPLPPYTRSDNLLSMFPALRAHVEARHGPLEAGDVNSALPDNLPMPCA